MSCLFDVLGLSLCRWPRGGETRFGEKAGGCRVVPSDVPKSGEDAGRLGSLISLLPLSLLLLLLSLLLF